MVLRHVRSLSELLSRLQRKDVSKLANLTADAVASANSFLPLVDGIAADSPESAEEAERRGAFALARLCGMEVRLRFDDLVRFLLSSTAAADLALLNPFVDASQIERALEVGVALRPLPPFLSHRPGWPPLSIEIPYC